MPVMLTLLEMKWPFLLFEFFLLFSGFMLVITGIKVRKQSKWTACANMLIGGIITLSALYLLVWTFVFGYNS